MCLASCADFTLSQAPKGGEVEIERRLTTWYGKEYWRSLSWRERGSPKQHGMY